ncbi:MAG: DMT family transporter [Verrucomicrobia bacterium]|nr:MAG: DMT family transporter [Verrucomicrobiota bacterium]
MLAAIFTTLLFALSGLSGRRLANHLSGAQANLLRLILAASILGSYAHLCGFGVSGPAFSWLFVSGCIGFGFGDLALFHAYPRIGTRRTMVLVQCLAAPIAALTEWIWLGTLPSAAQALLGAVILLGVGIALMPGRAEVGCSHGLLVGGLFGTLAALCQAWGAVLSRKGYAVAAAQGFYIGGMGGGVNAAYQRLLGGLVVAAVCVLYLKFGNRRSAAARPADWRLAWPLIIANSLCGPAFGVSCYQWALSGAPTSIVLPIVATTPLVVMPLAHFLEGDKMTARTLLGGILAVGGGVSLALLR